MPEPSVETRVSVLETRHSYLVEVVTATNESLRKLSDSTQALVRIEEQNRTMENKLQEQRADFRKFQTDVTDALAQLGKRVAAIEAALTPVNESRGWFLKGLGIIVAAVLGAVLSKIGLH